VKGSQSKPESLAIATRVTVSVMESSPSSLLTSPITTRKLGIPGPKWLHLPLLTMGHFGISIFWSVEMSYASPYLVSLGLSKPSIALVFLAGPLSGLIVQPLVGALADGTTSRFGRRRPWMLAGALVSVFSMLLLGFARTVAGVLTGRSNAEDNGVTILLAVIAIYLANFSVNAIMAMDRALVVDVLPISEQAAGTAWAARMNLLGGVVGFFTGTISLPSIFPFFGRTQLEVLSVIVSVLLLGVHLIIAICVEEQVLLKQEATLAKTGSFVRRVKEFWGAARSLPWTIRQIVSRVSFFKLFGKTT
jgi:solute carrier family 45, member 1/2/4